MSGADQNLMQCLLAAATQFSARPALQAFGRTSLSYSQFGDLLKKTTATLRAFGFTRADTMAMVLPNGPEMGSAFLTTAACCCSAPLNPAYKLEELDFYLSDLNATALLVAEHDDGPAVAVARQRNIPVLRLCTDQQQAAGYFTLQPENNVPFRASSSDSELPAATDTALALHTSGTTSRPKLVPLSQGNLVASARHIAETLRLSPDDHCLNLMPLFHIHGLVGVLLSSLSAGASVTCSPGFMAPKVLGWLGETEATWYSAVPTMHQALVARTRQESMPSHRLRFIRSSSAALPPQVMQQLEEAFRVPVVESYGMTEAAHQMASNPLPPRVRKPGSVGPAAGPSIAVMDAAGNLLRQGETGEVVIRGPNVTTGYVANPQANAEAFRNGWFRTGDQGYLDEDGYLYLTGRLKELINRGGEKISPREIDEVLLAHPAVAQAVAFAMPDDKLGEEVAAAVVLHEGQTADEPTLQDFAAEHLADFKVPRRIVLLNDIPKGPTGKLQRINLAEKLGLATSSTAAVAKSRGHRPEETGDNPAPVVAARTETETRVVAFFAEVLGLPPAGIDHHFFEAGGDSITAAQLLARVSAFYGGAPSLVRFFQMPTPRDVAMWLEGFQSATALAAARQGIPRQPEGATPQPSPAQEAMWFLDLLEQDRRVLLRPAAWRLRGPLDREALTRALETIVARQEALRQQFHNADGRLEVRIHQNAATQIAFHDLGHLPEGERIAAAETLSREIALRPFALDREPVFRTALLRLAQDEHWLVFTVHHIVSDGWSGAVFEKDLRQAYDHFARAEPLRLPELAVSYSDYSAWLRGRMKSADWKGQLAYWQKQLEGAPPYLSLPYDRPQDSREKTPPDQQNRGGQVRSTLPLGLTQRLRTFTEEGRHTLFMVLLAAFQALLSRMSHDRDFVVATPFANRSHPELESLVGLFINLLPLRARLEDTSTFNDLLVQARAAGLEAHANQEVPFDTILSAIRPERERARTPFMQVLFQVRNYPREAEQWPDLAVEPLQIDWRVCGFDISLEVEEREDALQLLLSYHYAAFEAATAQRILKRYQTLLESALAAPKVPVSALGWLPDEETELVLRQWNQTEAAVREAFVDTLIEEQAARFPDRVAMIEETRATTYDELNARANWIATGLRMHGVNPGDLVGIAIERSIDAAVCSLAVLKAGGVFLPLEIDHPQPRLQRILDTARPKLVVCSTRSRELQPELGANWLHQGDCQSAAEGAHPTQNGRQQAASPADAGAYVMYTSGSSGVPKGVFVSHRAAINFMQGFEDLYGFGAEDCQLWKANCSFDLSIQEWLVPLMLGGTVAICPPGRQADIPFLLDFMEAHRVTTIDGVPAFHRLLLEAQHDRPRKLTLRHQLVGAAPMSRELERFLIDHSQCPVHNQYGPTEATVYATVQRCEGETPGSIVPLGRPMRNARAYVLDEGLNPAGVGVSGEIWLGGEGVALGYWNDAVATAERFFHDPFSAAKMARMYRTGDLGRWLPDGRLEFLGRVDNQVKLRGFRIELEDIESALESLPGVRHAAVVLVGVEEESAYLAAWVEGEEGIVLEERALRQQAAAQLPAYMVPSLWEVVESLPRTATGKLNRKALSEVPLNASQAFHRTMRPRHDSEDSPRNATESKILEIWAELLPGTMPGTHDDFFDLGGHSLKAVILMSRIEKELGARLPLSVIFEARTITQLAAHVKREAAALAHSTKPRLLIPLQTKGAGTPLVLLHALGGHVLLYRELAEAMGSDRPVYAVQALGSDGASTPYTDVASMAKHYVQELESAGLLHQPVILGGFCFGAYLAIEMAALVEARGGRVPMLIAFDTDGEWRTVSSFADSLRFHRRQLQRRGLGGWSEYVRERFHSRRRRKRIQHLGGLRLTKLRQGERLNSEEAVDAVWAANALASERYKPKPFAQPLLYLKGMDAPPRDPSVFWGPLAQGGLEILEAPGREFSMFEQPAVGVLAERLTRRIIESEGPAKAPATQAIASGRAGR